MKRKVQEDKVITIKEESQCFICETIIPSGSRIRLMVIVAAGYHSKIHVCSECCIKIGKTTQAFEKQLPNICMLRSPYKGG